MERRDDKTMDALDMRTAELSAQGYCCTQVVASVALDLICRDNPDLLRALHGFGGGMGGTKGICGALSGGIAFLGLYGGKGGPEEDRDEELYPMVAELKSWFLEKWGTLECSELAGEEGERKSSVCPELVAETARKCISILESRGINPENGR